MIQVSYEELILVIFLGPILSVLLFNIIVFTLNISLKIFTTIKNHRSFTRKMREIERRKKEEGFMHQWVTINYPSLGSLMICKETGFCPKLNGFFDVKWVESTIESENKTNSVIKQRQDYFKSRLKELSLEFNMEMSQLENLSEKILSINKDFTIKKLEDLENEIKEKRI